MELLYLASASSKFDDYSNLTLYSYSITCLVWESLDITIVCICSELLKIFTTVPQPNIDGI